MWKNRRVSFPREPFKRLSESDILSRILVPQKQRKLDTRSHDDSCMDNSSHRSSLSSERVVRQQPSMSSRALDTRNHRDFQSRLETTFSEHSRRLNQESVSVEHCSEYDGESCENINASKLNVSPVDSISSAECVDVESGLSILKFLSSQTQKNVQEHSNNLSQSKCDLSKRKADFEYLDGCWNTDSKEKTHDIGDPTGLFTLSTNTESYSLKSVESPKLLRKSTRPKRDSHHFANRTKKSLNYSPHGRVQSVFTFDLNGDVTSRAKLACDASYDRSCDKMDEVEVEFSSPVRNSGSICLEEDETRCLLPRGNNICVPIELSESPWPDSISDASSSHSVLNSSGIFSCSSREKIQNATPHFEDHSSLTSAGEMYTGSRRTKKKVLTPVLSDPDDFIGAAANHQ